MNTSQLGPEMVTFLSIIFLILFNYFNRNQVLKFLINAVFLCESIVLTFFFSKFPYHLSFFILLTSIFFLYRTKIIVHSYNPKDSFYPEKLKSQFKNVGIALLISIFVYEYFSAWSFSNNALLVGILSLLFYSYNFFSEKYEQEMNFLLIFFFSITIIHIFPTIMVKILTGGIGTSASFSVTADSEFINFFLTKPLEIVLNLLGIYSFSEGNVIYFEDSSERKLISVGIANTCAGIQSLTVVLCFIFTYYLTIYRRIDYQMFHFLLLGTLISYLANLMRMSIVVLSGHFRGLEFLEFVHETVGWILFTIWMIPFSSLLFNQNVNMRYR